MKSILGLGLYLVGGLLCAVGGGSAVWGAAKPNVIVILADDAAYSDFGFSAALNNRPTQVDTPNLDALAQQSVIASSYYTPVSICGPTRAGILTGQYPQRFGYEDNPANFINSTQGLPADKLTIAQRLKPLGYTTGVIGKWHVGDTDGVNRPGDKGFDESYVSLGGTRDYSYDSTPQGGIWKNNQFYEAQYRVEGDHSRYDPVRGRYVTDAFGEEATAFVNRHAQDQNPFFLYVSFTAPHVPLQAKQSDLDHFANIADPTARTIAAMNYATDRAVGDVLNALSANGIDDNTIVIFSNDNGAPYDVLNPPYKGFKGSAWEGGTRVPYLIKGPGLQHSVYNAPISGYDLLPTIVAAAGGDISQFEHDGTNVMPFLKGEATDDPNRPYIMRLQGAWEIREGDWKVVLPTTGAAGPHLFNIKNDPGENVFGLYLQYPQIYAKLQRDFTDWEARMAKPKWGAIGALDKNTFDRFVFRNNLAATTNWSAANSWLEGGTNNIKTAQVNDAYANGIFEFTVRNDADYTANNDMKRMSQKTFMLNELRLTGNFSGASAHQGNITGNAVLFVTNLSGGLPTIRLDATASGTPAGFKFRIDNELQLLNDLEITGNGTQNFQINGRIRDYFEPSDPNVISPHGVRKSGSSLVTLTNNNTFTGALTVAGGEVALGDPAAAINGASSIAVKNGAKFSLHSGLVKTPSLDIESGGQFLVDGGRLETKTITGDLAVNGGTFAPGLGTAISTISNNLLMTSGILQLDLGGAAPGTGFDQLLVGGSASIAGALQVQLTSGFVPTLYQTFDILMANDLTGVFSINSLPTLPNGLAWRVLYSTHSISLAVRPPGQSNVINPVGDYNLDGVVNAADYTVWRDSVGSTTYFAADGNGDHIINELDYNIWKAHFGESYMFGGAALTNQSVPEPHSCWIAAITAIICKCEDNLSRRARKRSTRAIDPWTV